MLAKGPPADIFPFLLLPTGPDIMTAPGAMIIKPKKAIKIITTSSLTSKMMVKVLGIKACFLSLCLLSSHCVYRVISN